jgi:hypothetical protein
MAFKPHCFPLFLPVWISAAHLLKHDDTATDDLDFNAQL